MKPITCLFFIEMVSFSMIGLLQSSYKPTEKPKPKQFMVQLGWIGFYFKKY